MKDYNLGLLAPGASKQINVLGDYVRNLGVGSVRVSAYNSSEPVKAFDTVIGPGGSRSPRDEYTTWQITNESAITIAVSVLIGHGVATESDVTISTDVVALTRFDNLTVDGNRFFAGYPVIGSVGIRAHCALWNQAGSGIVANVSTLRCNASGDDVAFTYINNVASFINLTPFGFGGGNKILGGAAPVCRMYQSNAFEARQGTPLSNMCSDTYGTPSSVDYGNEPVRIPPGYGFCLSTTSTNTKLSVTFEWSEEPEA